MSLIKNPETEVLGEVSDDSFPNGYNTEMINKIRRTTLENLVNDILSVQPMPNDVFSDILKNSKSREHLIEEGYEPVCETTRLMWIKKTPMVK